jgi:hypothetical protein
MDRWVVNTYIRAIYKQVGGYVDNLGVIPSG